jgi:hypothetical protein
LPSDIEQQEREVKGSTPYTAVPKLRMLGGLPSFPHMPSNFILLPKPVLNTVDLLLPVLYFQ